MHVPLCELSIVLNSVITSISFHLSYHLSNIISDTNKIYTNEQVVICNKLTYLIKITLPVKLKDSTWILLLLLLLKTKIKKQSNFPLYVASAINLLMSVVELRSGR